MSLKVVLAYSGGLDTSIIVPWLKENYSATIVCMAGDVGQEEEVSFTDHQGIADVLDGHRLRFRQQLFIEPRVHGRGLLGSFHLPSNRS